MAKKAMKAIKVLRRQVPMAMGLRHLEEVRVLEPFLFSPPFCFCYISESQENV